MEPAPDGPPLATSAQHTACLFFLLVKVVLMGEGLLWNESGVRHVPV